MHRPSVVVAAAIVSFALLAAARPCPGGTSREREPETVTFHKKDPAPGDRRKETRSNALTLRLSVKVDGNDAGPLDLEKKGESERTTTVLGPRKREVTYGRVMESEKSTGEEAQVETAPVSGSTYLVERTDEGIVVARADGKEIALAEEMFVRGEFEELGEEDPLGAFLDGRAVRVGETLDVPKRTFEGMFPAGAGEELVVESFRLTLRDVRPIGNAECAAFDAAIRLAILRVDGPTSKIDLDGPIVLRTASCWPVASDLRGPITTTFTRDAGGRKIEMEGRGEASFSIRAEYPAD